LEYLSGEDAMKMTLLAVLILLASALTSIAQTTDNATNPDPTVSILVLRTGVQTEAPHAGTYHYFEFFQLRGNWIYPDFGYLDFNDGTGYRELFVGAGRTLYHSDRATIAEELYFAQATGPDAKSARYLWPWTLVDFKIADKLTTETVYLAYLPLNQPARIQHVLERAKVEYQVAKHVKVGGGYAGYKYGDGQWQSKPMIATTVSTNAGSFEFWLQKMPGGGQVQIRYTLVHTAHH
jgi:opacity protein-like surface antigen